MEAWLIWIVILVAAFVGIFLLIQRREEPSNDQEIAEHVRRKMLEGDDDADA